MVKINKSLYIIFFIFIMFSIFFFINNSFNNEDSYTVFVKCGDSLGVDKCVQLYPEFSKYTTNNINMNLDLNAFVMNCVDDGYGEFSSCIGTLQNGGCDILSSDTISNHFYILAECVDN